MVEGWCLALETSAASASPGWGSSARTAGCSTSDFLGAGFGPLSAAFGYSRLS